MIRKSDGVTLLEMMIVVAIIGIISLVSVASFKYLISQSVASVASEDVVVGLYTAKTEALKKRSGVVVCALKAGTVDECSNDVSDWKNGYIIRDEFSDAEGGNAPLYVGQIHTPVKALASHAQFTYNGEGRASAAVEILYCDNGGVGKSKLVRVYRSGVPKVEQTTAGCTPI